jgi:hypothetical protein
VNEELKRIEELEREIQRLKGLSRSKVPTYSFSQMTDAKLKLCVTIHRKFDKSRFKDWFNSHYNISKEDSLFLDNLLESYGEFLDGFKEESLKALFIIPILNRVNFFLREYECAGLYEERLTYETEKFIFNGTTDFIVGKGLEELEKPYFFIQEFKRNEENSFPRVQLLAELISAVEINSWKTIRGAYIKGAIWNFVILEKLEKDSYQYFVSQNFDSSKIADLRDIFKNLLFIKNEIIDMMERDSDT